MLSVTLWLSVEKGVFFPFSNRAGRSFCSKQLLQKLCYEVNHAASYVLHRDDNYPQIGSLAVLYKTSSCVHNLLIMSLEILSSVLLSLSNLNFLHDMSLLCTQMLIFISTFYNLEFFSTFSSDIFVYSCCENHASL